MPGDWTESEVAAIVADYFAMLAAELRGEAYNKSAHRRGVAPLLDGRPRGAIERKHQNISAVLIEQGLPYVEGYKPLRNYQRRLLPDAVADYLAGHPEMVRLIANDAEAAVAVPSVQDILGTLVAPPRPAPGDTDSAGEPQPPPGRRFVDYLAVEARNQRLGALGEQFALNFERARLVSLGREALADKVEQVSASEGPAAGFDIRSFDEGGEDRFVEVKTTKYGSETPFYMSPHELAFSKDEASRYYVYRLFLFRKTPRLFMLHGDVARACRVEPAEYLVRVV